MDAATLARLNGARAARQAVAMVTDLATGMDRLVRDVDGDPLAADIADALRSGRSRMVGEEHFVRVHLPPPRMVLIGAVHISQALFPMAQAAGFEVTIIDPRSAFATAERFAGVECIAEWPSEVLPDRPLDRWTALAALTHDPKIDDEPLQRALEAGCFYVGALGSRKTHAKRLERLRTAGVAENALERIESPIGLDIGASGPAEIAVAILASVIGTLRA